MPPEPPPRSAHSQEPPSESESPLILIVDDDPTLLQVLAMGLEDQGYRVLMASSQDEATHIVDQCGIAALGLVIADMYLSSSTSAKPEGYQLYETWMKARPSLPILFISDAKAATFLPAVLSGAVPLLVKPFTSDELLARVAALVAREHTPEA